MSVLDKMKKAGSIRHSGIMDESEFFSEPECVPTSLPVLNIAFSGELTGGLVSGITIFAGQSKSFKTLLGLFCLKAYLDKYPDGCAIIYDSEFGITPQYLKSLKIDTSRIIHVPIQNIEQLKFDYIKKLEELNRDDRVFTLIDSLGSVASKKEIDDAIEEKTVVDMTRAKAIRSFFRTVSPNLMIKNLPCIVINHVYQTQEMYSKTVVSGGTSTIYWSNQVFIISRSQEKEGTDVTGYKFTITVDKSRFVREKSQLQFTVSYGKGINPYSGLMDIALAAGVCTKPSNGWYSKINVETGEITPEKFRLKDTNNKAFWQDLLTYEPFMKWIEDRYKLKTVLSYDEEIEEETFDE